MKSKRNNAYYKKHKQTKYTYFIGEFPGEVRKIRSLFAQAIRRSNIASTIDTVISRKICCPIPPDQAAQVARANGEKMEGKAFQSHYLVRTVL